MMRYLLLILGLVSVSAGAAPPALNQTLPLLVLEDRGELLLEGDEFSFSPWRSDSGPEKVHVLQYFAGTKSASEAFEPFTDRLQEVLVPETYHVTTVINLDAALWGTTGFVVSELKANKRRYPLATLVLDEDGLGAKTWELGKKGALLAIMDATGQVRFLSNQPMTPEQIEEQAAWMAAQTGESAGAVSSQ